MAALENIYASARSNTDKALIEGRLAMQRAGFRHSAAGSAGMAQIQLQGLR